MSKRSTINDFQVFHAGALLFEQDAQDLETAIARARAHVKRNINYDDINPNDLFVCAKPHD